ncbi:MAG: hypothetical protein R3E95_05890 [Thiolinea sp.]
MFSCLLLLGSLSTAHAADTVPVLCYDNVVEDYHLFLNGRDPLELDSYAGPKSRRDVIEIVILQQALARGGFKKPITLSTEPGMSYKRTMQLMQSGDYLAICTSNWLKPILDIDGVKPSSIVIPSEKFIAGLFTGEDRVDEIKISSVEDARRYKILCNTNWIQDQQTIDAMQLNCVETRGWETMVRMLADRRGDFMLAPFQSRPDGALEAYDLRFKPIPGVKVRLDDDRTYMVSMMHPDGAAFYAALNKGLDLLRAENRLEQAYTESGFYNQSVKDWTLLNPAEPKSD